ncbi:MAG: cohesin domain-containing protein [bacterium]
MGQPSAAWTPLAATHANANGDSIVNQGEISAIGLNWGKFHYPLSSPADGELEKSQTPASAMIVPEIIPAVQPPNREFFMRIKVAEVNNLFGLSFELNYDQPQLLQLLTVEPDSLFGQDVVFYPNIDATNGEIAVGISRKAGQASVNGNGSVLRIKAKIAANATADAKISFSLQNVAANDANGAAINLSPPAASLTISNTTGIDSKGETSAPTSYRLLQNHPNPFNAGTLIKYEIPQAGPVSLKIYNLAGQEILEMVNAVQQPGRYQINWNGRNGQGKIVPSGIYVFKLLVNGFEETRKMTFMK